MLYRFESISLVLLYFALMQNSNDVPTEKNFLQISDTEVSQEKKKFTPESTSLENIAEEFFFLISHSRIYFVRLERNIFKCL